MIHEGTCEGKEGTREGEEGTLEGEEGTREWEEGTHKDLNSERSEGDPSRDLSTEVDS